MIKYSQIPQLGKAKAVGNQNTNQPQSNQVLKTEKSNSGINELWGNNKPSHEKSNSSPSYFSSENIKLMQSAINELASVVMDPSTFTKPLNDFLASNYISSLDPNKKGAEIASSIKIDKPQIDTYDIDVVMGNLQKIVQDKINKVKGVWDSVTDNLLKNISGLAHSLLQLEGDFRLKNQNYTSKNLEEFNQLISGYSIKNNIVGLSKDDQDKRAAKIYSHLKAIKNLYVSFKYQIQSRPEYRSLLEIKKGLDRYTDSIQLTPEEEDMLENPYLTITLQDKDPRSNNIIDFVVPLSAFSNREEFMNYMKKHGIVDEKTAQKYLSSFVKKINDLRV